MSSYQQFTQEQRTNLAFMIREGYEPEEIAITLCKHIASVYREINRNSESDGAYYGSKAHGKTLQRRRIAKSKLHKIPNNKQLSKYIHSKVKK